MVEFDIVGRFSFFTFSHNSVYSGEFSLSYVTIPSNTLGSKTAVVGRRDQVRQTEQLLAPGILRVVVGTEVGVVGAEVGVVGVAVAVGVVGMAVVPWGRSFGMEVVVPLVVVGQQMTSSMRCLLLLASPWLAGHG